ncbi:MAG: hypothetical protein AAGA16_11970, partial [Cyanobacteria bacterium P01_E01_bin.35]
RLGESVSHIYIKVPVSPRTDLRTTKTLNELLEQTDVETNNNRWFVEGKPGSGKSTMAKQLARNFAKSTLDKNCTNDRIPIYVYLPEFAKLRKSQEKAVLDPFLLGLIPNTVISLIGTTK